MITPFTIYLITRLDTLTSCLNVIAIILFAGAFIYFLFSTDANAGNIEEPKKIIKNLVSLILAGVITIIINLALPSSKDVILMYGIPAAINAASHNKQVTQLPDNILKFVNTWLEKETIENHNININK